MDKNEVTGPIPNFSANQFVVSMGAREVSIIFGQSLRFVDTATGQPHVSGTEWFANYVLSPISAQQLCEALDMSLKNYQERFGKIPVDPAASPTLTEESAAGK